MWCKSLALAHDVVRTGRYNARGTCGPDDEHPRNDRSREVELYYKTTHANNHARGPCDQLILIASNDILTY
jgi:hypothetical protein